VRDKFTTQVLSLVSGKGGSGKTALAISAGYMLSILGYKTLLVDLDFNTHGLSYFFEGLAKKHGVVGLLDLIPEPDTPDYLPVVLSKEEVEQRRQIENRVVAADFKLGYSEKLDVALSKVNFMSPSLGKLEGGVRLIVALCKELLEANKGLYHYIILDSQAGPCSSTLAAIDMSDKYVIVAEPDSLSIAAVRNLEYETEGKARSAKNFVLNKVFPQEIENVEAMSNYLRLFDHLTPIPFDFEVRKAFTLKQIPFEQEVPTLFSVSVIRFLQEVFPELSKEFREKADSLYREHFEGIESKREALATNVRSWTRVESITNVSAYVITISAIVYFTFWVELSSVMNGIPTMFLGGWDWG